MPSTKKASKQIVRMLSTKKGRKQVNKIQECFLLQSKKAREERARRKESKKAGSLEECFILKKQQNKVAGC